jgi:hypothetical protein
VTASSASVQTIAEPDRHTDGDELVLVVDANGSKRGSFKFKRGKQIYEMGLGALTSVPLAHAREVASECHAFSTPFPQRELRMVSSWT